MANIALNLDLRQETIEQPEDKKYAAGRAVSMGSFVDLKQPSATDVVGEGDDGKVMGQVSGHVAELSLAF